MHPALSVIAFTVLSGAGFGLVLLTAALDRLAPELVALTGTEILAAGLLGIALATAGLLASTLHLANPKNAWRAFFRFRSSWLSREGVFSVVFYPFALLWLAGNAFPATVPGAVTLAAAVLTVALGGAVLFSTGMIYASLRTIPQWHSPLVPTNYITLGLASGSLLLATLLALTGGDAGAAVTLALLLTITGAVTKGIYYYWIGAPRGSSINTALPGQTRAQVKLLESGQSTRTFLDKEFRYQVAASRLRRLRWLVALVAFAVPIALLGAALQLDVALLAVPAAAAALAGLAVERWLFFAEARHVVNLFYGAQRV